MKSTFYLLEYKLLNFCWSFCNHFDFIQWSFLLVNKDCYAYLINPVFFWCFCQFLLTLVATESFCQILITASEQGKAAGGSHSRKKTKVDTQNGLRLPRKDQQVRIEMIGARARSSNPITFEAFKIYHLYLPASS